MTLGARFSNGITFGAEHAAEFSDGRVDELPFPAWLAVESPLLLGVGDRGRDSCAASRPEIEIPDRNRTDRFLWYF